MDLLVPNLTAVFQWLLLMTALVALNFGVFRPVLHLFKERRVRSEGERAKWKELEERALMLATQCEKEISNAHLAGIREREMRLSEAEQKEREMVRTTRQEIDQTLERVRLEVERQGRAASVSLKQYGQEIGTEIAEKILGRAL